jgi:hypothetical protein
MMKTFKKWLELREAKTTGGTLRGKSTGGGFVANRSQFWGPAAKFGHEGEKVQGIANKAIGAVPAAVGSIFAKELGYTPEAVPFIQKWPDDLITKTHVIKNGTLPLQVLVKPTPECLGCGDDDGIECKWQNCEVDYEMMGLSDEKLDKEVIIPQKIDEHPSMYPNPADHRMVDAAKIFTEKLIMRDLWIRLLKDPSGNQTEYVDFKNPKIEKRILGTGIERYLTIVAMFPRTDVKQPEQY